LVVEGDGGCEAENVLHAAEYLFFNEGFQGDVFGADSAGGISCRELKSTSSNSSVCPISNELSSPLRAMIWL
jgi:hypothetical protein